MILAGQCDALGVLLAGNGKGDDGRRQYQQTEQTLRTHRSTLLSRTNSRHPAANCASTRYSNTPSVSRGAGGVHGLRRQPHPASDEMYALISFFGSRLRRYLKGGTTLAT